MTIPDISVVICTHDRAGSVQETLTRLAAADRTGLNVEVLVVDTGAGMRPRKL
jgi:glycosyltransferase involved in cell wall biosynthesis